MIDILVQPHRDQRAAERFFRKPLRGQGVEPLRITTVKLRSYSAAMRTIFGNVTHCVERFANNRAEASHQSTRRRERQMRRFKFPGQAQRFLCVFSFCEPETGTSLKSSCLKPARTRAAVSNNSSQTKFGSSNWSK